jgi:sporulation protein YlmC with PRC-barrel domain
MPTIDEIKTWQGNSVTDREGEKIGSIDEVYVDRDSGEPAWLAVKTGLFGNKLSFVPIADAARAGDDVRVPYDKAQVKDAPQVDADGELSEAEETDLYRHYGLEHAQPSSDRGDASGPATDEAMTRSEEELRVDTRQREVTEEVRKEQIEAARKASQR